MTDAIEKETTLVEGAAVQRRAVGFLAMAELLGMTLWFSASAVAPTLKADWELSSAGAAWLAMSVHVLDSARAAVCGRPGVVLGIWVAGVGSGVGVWAMLRPRGLPESLALAGGRR